jgi:DNA repair ATPase RecN
VTEPAFIPTTDRLLGVLIERTEALSRETHELRRSTDDLKSIHAETRVVLQNIADRLVQLEAQPAIPDLAVRLSECERASRDYWHVKDKVLAWALRIAAAVLLLGASGGALFKALFDR